MQGAFCSTLCQLEALTLAGCSQLTSVTVGDVDPHAMAASLHRSKLVLIIVMEHSA